jgi:hypothetical protein
LRVVLALRRFDNSAARHPDESHLLPTTMPRISVMR